MEQRLYTRDEVIGILVNLVNGIGLCAKGDIMPKRYKQKMTVEGKEHWVTGSTLQDLLESYLELCISEGTVVPGFILKGMEDQKRNDTIPFTEPYLKEFNRLYKDNQQSLTKVNREKIVNKHILPRFGGMRLNEITTMGLQEWFNELDQKGYSHETLLKLKNVFSPVLDSAVEDGYIQRNPFSSKRLVIKGRETEHHKAIPAEKMAEIRKAIPEITNYHIRLMLAILCFTAMRLEEVLGLRWEDIDFQNNWIYIRRAVVHPTRNQPEIKETKTKSSERRIPLPDMLKKYLTLQREMGFILPSSKDSTHETPMSYTESRNIFRKIQEIFELKEYSAHDFRDTCATEWREAGIPTDIIAHLLGHSKSDITETRYVKYRDDVYQGIRTVMNNQNGTKS